MPPQASLVWMPSCGPSGGTSPRKRRAMRARVTGRAFSISLYQLLWKLQNPVLLEYLKEKGHVCKHCKSGLGGRKPFHSSNTNLYSDSSAKLHSDSLITHDPSFINSNNFLQKTSKNFKASKPTSYDIWPWFKGENLWKICRKWGSWIINRKHPHVEAVLVALLRSATDSQEHKATTRKGGRPITGPSKRTSARRCNEAQAKRGPRCGPDFNIINRSLQKQCF